MNRGHGSDGEPDEPALPEGGDEPDGFGRRLASVREPQALDDVDAKKWRADVASRLFGETPTKVSIGRYEIVRRVGDGASGVVYEAVDPQLERRVAIKLLRPGASARPERAAEHLAREAKTLAKLSHPNVLPVYDVGTHDDQVFIALELVVGNTLRQWLAERGRTLEEILGVFVQAGRGLAAAHAAGLVHRDFKPDNVLIGEDGRVRVSDFGIARRLDAEPEESAIDTEASGEAQALTTHRGAGTPGYMAPEQFLGDPVDARTDQFAFCVALHEALWGQRPFHGTTREQLAASVIAGRRRKPARDEPIPAWLERVILRGLSVQPASRFSDMEALLVELQHRPRRVPVRWLLGLVGAAGLGAGIAMLGSDPSPTSSPCADGHARLGMVWSSARAEKMRAAFEATGLTYATASAERVQQALDHWGERFIDTYLQVCDGADDDVVVHRMHCLQSRLLELDSLVGVFEHADTTIVEHAVAGAGALVDPAGCLHAGATTPADPAARERGNRLRERIAKAKALHDAGRTREALAPAREAAREAQDLGDPVLATEALLVAGAAEQQLLGVSNRNEAQATLYAAVLAAESSRRPDLKARALVEYLSATLAVGELERALEWEPKVREAVAAIGDPQELVGNIDYTMALAHSFLDDNERARRHAMAALDAFLHGDPSERRRAAACHNVLGELEFGEGRYAEALPHYERGLAIVEEEVGPHHVWAANAYGNMAEVHFQLGRYEKAHAFFQRSLVIRQETYGARSIWGIHSKAHVADVELLLGRAADSLALYEQALDERAELRALVGERPEDGVTLTVYRDIQAWDQDQWIHNGLALAFLDPGQPASAEAHARLTADGVMPDDKHHPDQIGRFDALGWALLAQDRVDEAKASFRSALDRLNAGFPADHPNFAYPHWGLGEVARRTGDLELARTHLEEALRLREARPESLPRDLGDIRSALAQVRWAEGDHDEARALAVAAEADYLRATNRRSADLSTLRALMRRFGATP
jgi:tetratricopeptide (TPR) repeat protein